MVVALTAAACGSSSTKKAATTSTQSATTSKPTHGGSLVVGIRAETNGWNPALDQWADTG